MSSDDYIDHMNDLIERITFDLDGQIHILTDGASGASSLEEAAAFFGCDPESIINSYMIKMELEGWY
jgi:hypothetical protein